jgi:hypothetical protein
VYGSAQMPSADAPRIAKRVALYPGYNAQSRHWVSCYSPSPIHADVSVHRNKQNDCLQVATMNEHYWSYDRERGWIIRQRPAQACIKCGGQALRIPRRLVDRLFVSRSFRRYECRASHCGWTGNLPDENPETDVKERGWIFGFSVGLFAIFGVGLAFSIFVL